MSKPFKPFTPDALADCLIQKFGYAVLPVIAELRDYIPGEKLQQLWGRRTVGSFSVAGPATLIQWHEQAAAANETWPGFITPDQVKAEGYSFWRVVPYKRGDEITITVSVALLIASKEAAA